MNVRLPVTPFPKQIESLAVFVGDGPVAFDADEPPAELVLAADVEAPQSAAHVEGWSDVATKGPLLKITLRPPPVPTTIRKYSAG